MRTTSARPFPPQPSPWPPVVNRPFPPPPLASVARWTLDARIERGGDQLELAAA